MSIQVTVHDDRLQIEARATSLSLEIPLERQDAADPLCVLAPGLPPHLESRAGDDVHLYQGWVVHRGVPLLHLGEQGSLGNGIKMVPSSTAKDRHE